MEKVKGVKGRREVGKAAKGDSALSTFLKSDFIGFIIKVFDE